MKVLFLCTGNYYRSRFAELLFNHLVSAASLPHHADSRALALERGGGNVGPISASTADALTAKGVKMPARHRSPRQASEADFVDFDLIIALKEAEHRPLMTQRFPAHAGRVQYWHVHDLDAATPQEALAQIETNVRQLIGSLAGSAAAAPPLPGVPERARKSGQVPPVPSPAESPIPKTVSTRTPHSLRGSSPGFLGTPDVPS